MSHHDHAGSDMMGLTMATHKRMSSTPGFLITQSLTNARNPKNSHDKVSKTPMRAYACWTLIDALTIFEEVMARYQQLLSEVRSSREEHVRVEISAFFGCQANLGVVLGDLGAYYIRLHLSSEVVWGKGSL